MGGVTVLRLAGCFLISGGCMGLGFWYREQLSQRIWHLHRLGEILEMMVSEIRFNKATLPECCMRLSRRLPSPYDQVFAGIQEAVLRYEGESFGVVFVKNMRTCLEQTPLKKGEKELFLQFAENVGFEDTQMQILHLEQYKERLKAHTDRLEGEAAERGRIALRLGVMGGLLLIILFC